MEKFKSKRMTEKKSPEINSFPMTDFSIFLFSRFFRLLPQF